MTSSTGCSGLTLLRIAAEPDDAVAHRREIDDRRHAGEVLQQHARGHERDLLRRLRRDIPAGQRLDVVAIDEAAVLAAQQVLEQDLQRVRQPREPAVAGLLERGQAEEVNRWPPTVSDDRVWNEFCETILLIIHFTPDAPSSSRGSRKSLGRRPGRVLRVARRRPPGSSRRMSATVMRPARRSTAPRDRRMRAAASRCGRPERRRRAGKYRRLSSSMARSRPRSGRSSRRRRSRSTWRCASAR